MGKSKNYEFKIITIYALFCFATFVTFADAFHQSGEKKPSDLFTNKVNFSGDNFIVEWKVDQKAQCIEFKLNVVVGEKGWVLLGFMAASKNSSESSNQEPKSIANSEGDFVLTQFSSASEQKTLDLNTIKTAGVLQPDDNTTRMDYQVTAENPTENSSVRVLHITRKLDTGDPQDVPITDLPMWIFGAYGNSNGNSTDLAEIKDNTNDNLEVKKVIFMKKTDSKTDDSKAWHKMLKEQVKKHWIGVVIGGSALLSVMIVAMVYLCSRKGKIGKSKNKIKMTFYKEDEDDEAKVAFLHSRT